MIDEFRKFLKKDGRSVRTIILYTKIIEEFEKWYYESHHCEFHHLRRSDVKEFEHYLKDYKKYRDSTIKLNLSVLSKFNIYLVRNKIQNKLVI